MTLSNNRTHILVTGGAGYIGSHAVRALVYAGFKVTVLDNLACGHAWVVREVLRVTLIIGKVGDVNLLRLILKGDHPACLNGPVDAVLHFAAYAYVSESVSDPARYYRNNFVDSLTLLELLVSEGCRRNGSPIPIVFSSTCATYGVPESYSLPIDESCPQSPINPYGRSKLMVEQLIQDFSIAYRLPSVIFRYFNAAGADPLGDIGEIHTPETHLIPLLFDVVTGLLPSIEVFGTDYPTADGTCIRDFVHVSDLASAHVLGLQRLLENGGQHIYNLGTGFGFSVFEVIDVVKEVTGCRLNWRAAGRREGDPPVLVASARKACAELGWQPAYPELSVIVKHAWVWHQKLLASRRRLWPREIL